MYVRSEHTSYLAISRRLKGRQEQTSCQVEGRATAATDCDNGCIDIRIL